MRAVLFGLRSVSSDQLIQLMTGFSECSCGRDVQARHLAAGLFLIEGGGGVGNSDSDLL